MKTLLFLLFIQGCYFQKETLPEKYNIVLCVGQSNMAGAGIIEPQDSNSGAFLWNDTGWEAADGHLNRYTNLYTWNGLTWLSLTNSFGKEAALHNNRVTKTGLVVNAYGGTNIESWESTYMALSIQRAQEALTANPGSKITAILWHQGEANVNNSQVWLPAFSNIRTQVDTTLGANIPILVGGLSTGFYSAMNDILVQCEQYHDCYFISSVGLLAGDGTHFSAASLRTFGLRYYQKYEQVKL